MMAAAFVSVVLFSCVKDNHSSGNSNIPVAGLMVFNLAPDKPAVSFALSGSALTASPLSYGSYSGNYLSIYTGTRTVDAYDYYSASSTLASTSWNFDSAGYYSAFLVGAGQDYRNIVVTDNFDSLPGSSGQAYIRYINAIPDSLQSPAVTISAAGSNIVSTAAAFGNVSPFYAIIPGSVTVDLKHSGGIDVNRTFTVDARKVYTILLTGVPSSGSTPVAIKYILNGILDSTAAGTTGFAGMTGVQ
jgi:hypothetical protein